MHCERSTRRNKSQKNARSDKRKRAEPDNMEKATGTQKRDGSIASKLRKRMVKGKAVEMEATKGIRPDDERQNNGIDFTSGSLADPHEILMCNFGARMRPPHICSSHILTSLHHSRSLVHYLYGASLGRASLQNKKSLLSPVVRELDDLSLFRTASTFVRRTTALEWHPTQPYVLAAGSKGGDILLWDTVNQSVNDKYIEGIGPGGSIQAMKFWPWSTEKLVTASIDGRVTLSDFEGHNQVLSDTFNCMDSWFCCVDVSAPRKVVVTGDNVGNTLMLSLQGTKLWTHRLHKQKVTHAEFSPREDWLFCTASTDQTVKMWDIRKISGRDSALCILKHDKPVNSAYFSRTDGCRLLTTDQHSQIRVYSSPEWILQKTIAHPHRFFQHITPIKASWHPLQDLVVVGRYPDKEFPGSDAAELRTIDIFDATTGNLVCQLHDPAAPGIVSLNKFNDRGDFLASGMGVNILVWARSREVEERQLALLESAKASGLDLLISGRPVNGSRRSSSRRGRNSSPDKKKAKKMDSEKLKMKLQTKTKTKNLR